MKILAEILFMMIAVIFLAFLPLFVAPITEAVLDIARFIVFILAP